MSKHMTIINLACTITKLRKWGEAWKHSAESAQAATARMHQAHEAKMAEHRAAFGARTEADAKIIAGLRVQVQDMRAEMERLRAQMSEQEVSVVGIINERNETWERFWAEVARLKSQTPKHPVKVGEWVRRLTGFNTTPAGEVARVTLVDDDDPSQLEYEVVRPNGQKGRWSAKGCEPCDPPAADHDTEAGKAAAESVIRDSRSAEIEMCVGDEVEVIGLGTLRALLTGTIAPIGTRGIATMIHSTAGFVELDNGTRASIKDVRKVTT